jgi:hypothetical protein
LQNSNGDVVQLGGDILIDPGGYVRLHHVGKSPADRPTVKSILGVVRNAESRRTMSVPAAQEEDRS